MPTLFYTNNNYIYSFLSILPINSRTAVGHSSGNAGLSALFTIAVNIAKSYRNLCSSEYTLYLELILFYILLSYLVYFFVNTFIIIS